MMTNSGVVGRNSPKAHRDSRREQRVPQQHALEAKNLQRTEGERLHEDRAHRRDECEKARLHGAQPEPELQHQRQQERRRADTDAKQRAADDTGAIRCKPE